MLTGRYQTRSGIYPRVLFPSEVGGLPLNETTIAETLKDVGYSTAIIGKWHLGVGENNMYLPTNHGFDYYMVCFECAEASSMIDSISMPVRGYLTLRTCAHATAASFLHQLVFLQTHI